MARALELAQRGYYSSRPNPRVGCVIARDGSVVGEGFHYRTGEAHAEVNALRDAGDQARGGTAYVTLEPCCHHGRTPPCTAALIDSGVTRVVYAAGDPNPRVAGEGAEQLRAAGIEVTGSLMAQESARLNRGFFRRMRDGIPFVTVKLGMSLDAKVALATGASKWITSGAARADVQRLRAASGAILTGAGTVLADDPAMTVRDERFDTGGRQPLRVILDSQLRVAPSSKIFRQAGETLVLTTADSGPKAAALRAAGATVEHCPAASGGLDLAAVLRGLAAREVNDVLVEAGPGITGAFIGDGLFDELIIYMAPKTLGEGAFDAFKLAPPLNLDSARALSFVDVRHVGGDLRLTLRDTSST